jgi:hypothetical protein
MKKIIVVVRDVLIVTLVTVLCFEATLRIMATSEFLAKRISFVGYLRNNIDFDHGMSVVEKNPLFRPLKNSILEYELIPNTTQNGIRINSFGFRGGEITAEPQPGVIRVIALGDSETLCASLEEELSFPKQIETSLNRYGQEKFEVLNFGVTGYNSLQELELLKTKALPLHPKVVVVRYVFNDAVIGSPQIIVDSSWLGLSRIYLLFKFLAQPITPLSWLIQETNGETWKFYVALHKSKYFDITKQYISQMYEAAAAQNVVFVLLVDPEATAPDLHDRYPYMAIHDALHALGAGRFEVIDPLPELQSNFKSFKQMWISTKNLHKNTVVNGIMADKIADHLINKYSLTKGWRF